MGFNKRKLEDQRRHAAEKEAAARRALDPQIIADAERLIEHWNERQAKRKRDLSAARWLHHAKQQKVVVRRTHRREVVH